jgi:hypothetical protein
MDACVRCLRDGPVENAANVVLIVDDANVQGGHAVFDQVGIAVQTSETTAMKSLTARLT